MVPLLDLWLPIVLSAVFVFVVSSVIHMALPMHKSDFKKLANEDQVLASLRTLGVQSGQYVFPCAGSMKEMGTPEMKAKLAQGPAGHMTVLPPGGANIGRALGQWFVFSLVIGACAAYVGGLGCAPGAPGMLVFRTTSAAALLGYGFSHAQESIWKGLTWGTTAKFFVDGILYSLATGATFAWLWPAAIGA